MPAFLKILGLLEGSGFGGCRVVAAKSVVRADFAEDDDCPQGRFVFVPRSRTTTCALGTHRAMNLAPLTASRLRSPAPSRTRLRNRSTTLRDHNVNKFSTWSSIILHTPRLFGAGSHAVIIQEAEGFRGSHQVEHEQAPVLSAGVLLPPQTPSPIFFFCK